MDKYIIREYLRIVKLSIICILLSACVYLPAEKPFETEISECKLQIPELELTVKMADSLDVCTGTGEDVIVCLVAVGVVVPAGSFLVSGSIVLVGNTARWIEYQGRCSDSALNEKLALLRNWYQ